MPFFFFFSAARAAARAAGGSAGGGDGDASSALSINGNAHTMPRAALPQSAAPAPSPRGCVWGTRGVLQPPGWVWLECPHFNAPCCTRQVHHGQHPVPVTTGTM